MARMVWTEKRIERMLAEGRGQGSGADYKPWIEVAEVSSGGRSRRVWSSKTGRTHHLLSDVEYDLFLVCEWAKNVVDIREQYPLPRDLTQTIAQELRIRHPTYPGTNIPAVMTVDFLLTLQVNGKKTVMALNAKRDEEADDVRSLEKLEIQRSTFERLGFTHHLVYHSQIPEQKVKNIDWIRGALVKPGEPEQHDGFFKGLADRMSGELATPADTTLASTLEDYCTDFDSRYGVLAGTGLRVARILMAERVLVPDLASPNITRQSLAAFIMTGQPGRLRVVGGTSAL